MRCCRAKSTHAPPREDNESPRRLPRRWCCSTAPRSGATEVAQRSVTLGRQLLATRLRRLARRLGGRKSRPPRHAARLRQGEAQTWARPHSARRSVTGLIDGGERGTEAERVDVY